ncbi:MAG TPA: LysR family transcriptional regulator [Gammaproteobacteria bacterium]|nr:LysR family transcriptional regulator [Gammaproteobacteria bacterium]|tara:strand:+ start:527 stop:997 length:471 start_codon:yes stop_codon:yes gene_type:complete
MTQQTVIETEFGYLKLMFDGADLLSVTRVKAREPGDVIDSAILGPVTDCIAGKRDGGGIPIQFSGSVFQVRAWNAIRSLQAGEVMSYTELAKRAGNVRATRAVAAACGKNPCAIVVPCHRIIRRDNGLGGFFWGLNIKRTLLKREGLRISADGRVF